MDLDRYLGELTKPQVFKGLMKVIGSNWMSLDDINKKSTLPISKDRLEAHLSELVRKGKVKETMQRGKYVYKLSEGGFQGEDMDLVDKYLGEGMPVTDYKKVGADDWIIYDEGTGEIQKIVKATKKAPTSQFVSSKSAAIRASSAATKMAWLFLKKNKGFSTLMKTIKNNEEKLTERAPSIGEPLQGKSPRLSPKGIKKEWERFYNMAKDKSGKYFKEFEKKYSGYKYQSPHIQDALKKSKNFEDFHKMIKKFEK